MLHSIGLEITMLLVFWVFLGVWHREGAAPGRVTFGALCVSTLAWCLGELLAARGVVDEFVVDRVTYAGVLSLPPLWLGVAAHSTQLPLARRVPWFPLVLLSPNAVLYALLYAGGFGELFLATRPGELDGYGPLWWVATGYGYLLVLAGCSLFVRAALRNGDGRSLWARLLVGVAPLLPLVVNGAYIASGMSWPIEPTPLLFSVVVVALRVGLFSGSLLQTLPISQHDLIEQLPIGVVLTDRAGVVVDVNPAAERRLGVPEASAIGRTLDAILAEASEDVNAEVAPVFSNHREAGQIVLIDPPGKTPD